MRPFGVLLAAGAGTRMGQPKALVGGPGGAALARAGYHGRAGHPVLMGRVHWEQAKAAATGERGAGSYLKRAGCPLIPCEDLASGNSQDL